MKKPHILYWKWNEDHLDEAVMLRCAQDIIDRSMFDVIYVCLHQLDEHHQLLVNDHIIALLKSCCARFAQYGRRVVLDIDPRRELKYYRENPTGEQYRALTYKQWVLNEDGSYSEEIPQSQGVLRCLCVEFDGQGCIIEDSVKDITALTEWKDGVITVNGGRTLAGKTVVCFPYTNTQHVDICGDDYKQLWDTMFRRVADIGLSGAATDEWSVRLVGGPQQGKWFCASDGLRKYYRARTGRELFDDILFFRNRSDKHPDKHSRIAMDFVNTLRARVVDGDEVLYDSTKRYFGKDALVLCHPTYMGDVSCMSIDLSLNGLDWWEVKRDFAQTDELVDIPIRMSMSRKCPDNLWYNMWYSQRTMDINSYFPETWKNALYGGRTHHLGYECRKEPGIVLELNHEGYLELLSDMEDEIEKLNAVQTTRPDTRILTVFSYDAAADWTVAYPDDMTLRAGNQYLQPAVRFSTNLLKRGYLNDIVPSSEIDNGSLTLKGGKACYGGHTYDAVIVIHPIVLTDKATAFFRDYATLGGLLCVLGDERNTLGGIGRLNLPDLKLDEVIRVLDDSNVAGNCGDHYCVYEDGSILFVTDGKKNVGNPLEIDCTVCGKHITFRGEDFLHISADNQATYGKMEQLSIE